MLKKWREEEVRREKTYVGCSSIKQQRQNTLRSCCWLYRIHFDSLSLFCMHQTAQLSNALSIRSVSVSLCVFFFISNFVPFSTYLTLWFNLSDSFPQYATVSLRSLRSVWCVYNRCKPCAYWKQTDCVVMWTKNLTSSFYAVVVVVRFSLFFSSFIHVKRSLWLWLELCCTYVLWLLSVQ